jgi:small subunit ribosomal protein S20
VPHHKSAKKRVRQTKVRTARNSSIMSETRTAIKKVRSAIADKDKSTAASLLTNAQALLAKLSKKGIIKPNTAARKTSRLSSQINGL